MSPNRSKQTPGVISPSICLRSQVKGTIQEGGVRQDHLLGLGPEAKGLNQAPVGPGDALTGRCRGDIQLKRPKGNGKKQTGSRKATGAVWDFE